MKNFYGRGKYVSLAFLLCVLLLTVLWLTREQNENPPPLNKSNGEGKSSKTESRSNDRVNHSSRKVPRRKKNGKRCNPVFADDSNMAGAREIILPSSGEPGKKEAPDIKLDENDSPVLDEKGNPVFY